MRFVVVVYWQSHVRLFATPWAVAHQAPLSMGLPRQKLLEWFPSLGYLPDPGIKPMSLVSPCTGRRILYHWVTWEAPTDEITGDQFLESV